MDLGLEGALGSSPGGVRDDDDDINISDVIEVIQTTDPDFKQSGMFSGGGEISTVPGQANTAGQRVSSGGTTRRQAYVKILEQPASKALRFRYECEGRSAGSIPGASSTPENKTFPAIQVIGYQGRAVVVVSCVTKDPPYRPHPHNLVGREGCRRGVCTLEVSPETMAVTFSNLGIQCVKKKDIEDALKVREEIRVDPFRTGFAHRNQPTSIDLNAVRLCFQVFLEGDNRGKFTVPLSPVVSDPIYDKKAMSDLVICKLSDCTCTVAGGKEIILLCEKVAKEDIQVRFYEESNGAVMWEALGDFQPTHVHKQVAISFRTPRYRTLEVSDPVKVFIQLRRPSDGATSESLPFELLPLDSGRPAFWSLRRALHKKGDYNTFNSILAADRLQINKNSPTIRQKSVKTQNCSAPLLFQSENKIDEVEIIEPPPAKSKPMLETNLDEVEITVVDEWQQNDLSKVTNKPKDWCDYSEVEKIAVNPKDIQNMQNIQNNNNNIEEKSLNDLLNQVAELDEIYSDTQARLLTINDQINDAIESESVQIQPMEVEAFDDSNTYSSLQLAFKNPIEIELPNKYDDVITAHGPVIEIAPLKRESDPEKLPPLPPKRIKKSIETPILDRAVSQNLGSNHSIQLTDSQTGNLFHTSSPNLVATPVSRTSSFNNITRPKSQELLAPSKKLPPTPCSTLPNPKKQSFLSKLFSKKPKKDKTSPNKANSTTNLNSRQSSLKTGSASLGGGSLCNISNSNNDGSIIHISLHPTPTGSLNDVNKLQNNQNIANNKLNGNLKDEDVINLDLTEAEHYALYTAMAPHATQSEFDEMSCYYAPVEGGKVLNNQPDMAARVHSNT